MEGAGVGGAWPATLGHDSGREEGEKEQGGPWDRSPAAARPEAVRGGLATAGGGRRRAWERRCKARRWPGPGGKGGREPRGLYCLPWFGLGYSGEGSSAVAGVLGRRQWWAEALGAREEAWSGGGGRGGEGRREGPFYRRNKAAGRAVGRWPWCGRPASSTGAINGDWRRGSPIRGGTGVTRPLRQRLAARRALWHVGGGCCACRQAA